MVAIQKLPENMLWYEDYDDGELFSWYGWCLASFPVGTIARDLHYRKSPARREQGLTLRKT